MLESVMKQSIEGWIARDYRGGSLYFYDVKPIRGEGTWVLPKEHLDARFKKIATTLFFDVNIKWEDEPRKVKITIEYDN